MQQFDAITQQYEGGDRSCTDGVSYAFERRNGPVTKSGTSATGCDKTYEEAARLLLTFARQFAPLPKSLS
ncbi:hypothetical protein SxD43FB_16745 [Sphingobium sp. D43FB]|nr:hypothetical protein SxD43FB_16745 [Sphingobium sp. D43FB]